ncbi:MAG: hypothetical protein ACRBB2_07120, partial [Nitrosopumilus sp.]
NVLQIPSQCTKLDYKGQKSVSISRLRIIIYGAFHAAKIRSEQLKIFSTILTFHFHLTSAFNKYLTCFLNSLHHQFQTASCVFSSSPKLSLAKEFQNLFLIRMSVD